MKCEEAREVYTSSNPLEKIQELFPLAWDQIEYVVEGLQGKTADKFNDKIHELAHMHEGSKFFITHRLEAETDDTSHQLQQVIGDEASRRLIEQNFLNVSGKQVHLALICCNSCIASEMPLGMCEMMSIQKHAVLIDPNSL